MVDVGYLDDTFFNSLQNRYLQNSYRSQLISALSFGYVYNNQRKNLGGNATVLRLNAEIAGNLLDGLAHLFSHPAEEGTTTRYSASATRNISASTSAPAARSCWARRRPWPAGSMPAAA